MSAPIPPPMTEIICNKYATLTPATKPVRKIEFTEEFSKLHNQLIQDNKIPLFYINRDCTPILQDGPQCGIVALSMALESLGNSIDITCLQNTAIDLGFTLQGEMFSVDNMCALAATASNIEAAVISGGLSINTTSVLQTLSSGGLLLVPYDSDHNWLPCLKSGHSSHWALITGFLLTTDEPDELQLSVDQTARNIDDGVKIFMRNESQQCYNIYVDNEACFNINISNGNVKVDRTGSGCKNCAQLHVFARQGKSSHLQLWEYLSLAESNDNLVSFSPSRDDMLYILPVGGVSQGLKGKAILLSKKNYSKSAGYV